MADMTGADYSPDLYEVTAGKRRHKTEKGEKVLLTKGDTFHPTQKQVADGSLENSARKVKEGSPKASVSPGEDIGIRALEWGSKPALKKALDAKPPVTVEELEAGDGPSGETGYVTDDVTAVLEARAAAEEEPDDSGGDAEGEADEEEGAEEGEGESEEDSSEEEPDDSGGDAEGEADEEEGAEEGEGESEEDSSEEEPDDSGGD